MSRTLSNEPADNRDRLYEDLLCIIGRRKSKLEGTILLIDFNYAETSRQSESSIAEIVCRVIHRFIVIYSVLVSLKSN